MPFISLYADMTACGWPSSTAISKPVRYNSRKVFSSSFAFSAIRRSSWLFTAKCFAHAPTPFFWIPLMAAAAIFPDKYGSSEKYSKFLPHNGFLFILSPGASKTWMFCNTASLPKASPTFSSSCSSQLLASVDGDGKQVAGTEGFSPRWSPAPSCLRTPLGPSEKKRPGIPNCGYSLDSHSFFPVKNAAFCFAVICFIRSSCRILSIPPSVSVYGLLCDYDYTYKKI